MYSNALPKNPVFKSKIAYKQGIEEYSIGTVTKICEYDAVPKQVHQTKYTEQRKAIYAKSQHTIEEHVSPKVYELDATLSQRLFHDINKNKANCQETSEKRSDGRTFTIPNIIQNNVTVETSKPMIFKEHVGGSLNYPTSKIGETLLKQKAIDFLGNDFPNSFSKLSNKLAMCLSIKGSTTDTTTSPPSSPKTQSKSKLNTVKTPTEAKLQQITLTDNTEYEERSAEEDANYKQILGKLTRIKSRITRNPTSEIAQPTIQYLRDLQIIQPEDTKSNIITKIDSAIVQLENHFDTPNTEVQDV
jgi:hypothetical protein